MRTTHRILIVIFAALCLSFPASLFGDTTNEQEQKAYEQQLKEYDQRVSEQRPSWLSPTVLIAAAAGILFWSQRTAKRRTAMILAHSHAAVAEASAQNKRIIELLESIDRKTSGPNT